MKMHDGVSFFFIVGGVDFFVDSLERETTIKIHVCVLK